MTSDVLIVHCTCPPDRARSLADTLVASGVAACVNLLPGLRSVYRWQGRTCADDETLLLIKTTRDRFEALRAAIIAQHPYELPEIVAVPVAAGHAPYLEWVADSVAEPCPDPSTPNPDPLRS